MKQSSTLTIQIEKPTQCIRQRLLLCLPGIALLAGVWGMVSQAWAVNTLPYCVISAVVLVSGMLLSWKKTAHRIVLFMFAVLLAVSVLALHGQLSQSLAAWLNAMGQWYLCRTGRYVLPFSDAGSFWQVGVLVAIVLGIAVTAVIRSQRYVWQMLVCLLVLAALMVGWCGGSIYALLLLAGTVALFAKNSKSLAYATALTAVLTAVVLVLGWRSGAVQSTKLSAAVEQKIHHYRYEDSQQVLPEGHWQQLSAYRPGDDDALRVTMEHWTSLYLPGFTGDTYTADGWQKLSGESVAQESELLYALQRDAFCADTQLGAAWQAMGKAADNRVSVQVLGACREFCYVPYGVDGLATDPAALTKEGSVSAQSYTANLYPVKQSYLLQNDLAQGDEQSTYRQAESAYRRWVYEHYLAVPKDVANTLSQYVSVPTDGMSTVQAKEEISAWLDQTLTYDESTGGAENLVDSLLSTSRRGHSVHYATLATLLMRQCGIPARYVEGYLVPQAQAQTLQDGDALTLTQCSAHAWVEYYLSGVGWLPYDPTPTCADELTYELPDGDSVALGSGLVSQRQTDRQKNNTLNTQTEKDKEEKQGKREINWWVILAAVMALAIAALIIRCAVLRSRLKRYCEVFCDADQRKATAYILSYAQRLNGDREVPPEIEALRHEIWYSSHAISATHRHLAEAYLHQTEQNWKSSTSLPKRLVQRWITCCVR